MLKFAVLSSKNNNPSLEKLIQKLPRLAPNNRVDFLLNYLGECPIFNSIKKCFLRGDYEACLTMLLTYIKMNKNIINLRLVFFDDGFVNNHLNDYSHPNNAVIRNCAQLIAIKNRLITNKNAHKFRVFIKLLSTNSQSKNSFLLVDRISDRKCLFQSILHEINAWLTSGCAGDKQSLVRTMLDWRIFIPRGGCKKLDNYMWGLPFTA